MFIGEYKHTIDDKNRLAIPVKCRGDLAKGAVVTRGLDSSLFVFTKSEWQKLAGKLTVILTDAELQAELSRGALTWAAGFNWDDAAAEFETLLNSIVEDNS